ncbi:RagB/SusD family nutrient uptake outer membrane protein [Sphingobacterium sp. JUb78]|uniref:RagB/SusD family nutrient uptake outer membrane protein n=1 Tax=Sphingobacterium sp. JUb78 TaxID=2485111 RepID=UPI001A9F9A60|nr:RagB/SusD family nutrient uptake outer membrane protein [Sphingobacterium sp. JUb78]
MIAILVSSCKKDFLEVAPKGSLIASKTFEYENMLYGSQSIGFDVPSIILADDAATISTYFNASNLRFQRLFRWESDIYEQEQSASELQDPIKNIYIYNKVINEVMDSQEGSTEYKRSLVAETKASRAYFNMMLVNYYGKPYNSKTATSDLGIPLIKLADVAQTSFTRATVQEVYDSMIGDLKEAIPEVPINVPHRLRMCRAAAEMTLAKIYWFMADYKAALEWINIAKSHLPTSFEHGLYDYNETFLNPSWSVSTGFNNKQDLHVRVSISQWVSSSNNVLLAPWVYKLYSTNDQRLKAFSNTPFQGTGVFPVAGIKRRTGPFGSQVGQGITMPDMELMKAECEARSGLLEQANLTVTNFRKMRMPQSEAVVPPLAKDDLIKFIIDERTREFALFGHRWFDMRRLSSDPLFTDKTYKHVIYDGQTGTEKETFTLDPLRLTLRLPRGVLEANPGMQDNL